MASRWAAWLAGCFIALSALAAYHNSFSGAFVLDDTNGILNNNTIRHLWPIQPVLSPPAHSGVGGRPLLNLSFALNYAVGHLAVAGYHWFNLVIHALAALVLFGLVCRTLLRPALRARFGHAAMPLALALAVLWLLHPLQTEAVTYVSQRAESLMGLWYLLTLYCFVRGAESEEWAVRPSSEGQSTAGKASGPRMSLKAGSAWYLLAVATCVLGMATKEVMVSAPLMVLLYDRTFFAGTFREAWCRRWRFYAGLMGAWILLGCLMTDLQLRGVGFDHGISWWAYALTECRVIVQYLTLAIWPHPLVFDYGREVVAHAGEAMPYVLVLAGLVAATLIGLWRRPTLGFLGAWIFMILAPSSSVVPVAGQPMAESRMYLPLAAVGALFVLGLHALAGRRSIPVFLLAAAGLGLLTVRRNTDYQSRLSLWSDTVAKRPGNARAHDSLASALDDAGKTKEAVQEYVEALKLAPDDPREHYNLGHLLAKTGRAAEAVLEYEEALKLNPDYAEAHNNLGALLTDLGRMQEAVAQYEIVLRLRPKEAESHYNLGNAYFEVNRLPESVAQYNEALQLNPSSAEINDNLGNALAEMGRFPEAIRHYEEALRLDPDYASAHNNLGTVLIKTGHLAEALKQCQEAIRLNPDFEGAERNLGDVYLQTNRMADAIAQYESALRLKPDDLMAHTHLGVALFQTGSVAEAMGHYQKALEISPDYAAAHYWLGRTLAQTGQIQHAIEELQEAVRLAPDFAEAHNDLGLVLMQADRVREAVGHFSEAVRLKPDYTKAADNLDNARAVLAVRNGGD